jgi:hypothetical protein
MGTGRGRSKARYCCLQRAARPCSGQLSAACVLIVFFVVPDAEPIVPVQQGPAATSLKTICAYSRFWRLAPLSATCVGSAWGLQGLWAVPWLSDVERLERPAIVQHLFVMALALSAGALVMASVPKDCGRVAFEPITPCHW